MPKALSSDLRSRVLAAIDAGLSCRQAATRFGVSASSAIRWQAMRRAGGDARPKPQGGDRLSRRTEAHADLIHAVLDEAPDITLPELKARLAGQGAQVSVSALWRFCPPPQDHAQKRMARPVCKRVLKTGPGGLRKRIRPREAVPPAKMEIRAPWSSSKTRHRGAVF
jgi:transposase